MSDPVMEAVLCPVGAFVERNNPSTVFVFDRSDKFGAIRVDGVWSPARLTTGEINQGFRPITDCAEVEAAVREARRTLFSTPVRVRQGQRLADRATGPHRNDLSPRALRRTARQTSQPPG
jgi:hypothetical protein